MNDRLRGVPGPNDDTTGQWGRVLLWGPGLMEWLGELNAVARVRLVDDGGGSRRVVLDKGSRGVDIALKDGSEPRDLGARLELDTKEYGTLTIRQLEESDRELFLGPGDVLERARRAFELG